MRDPNDALDQPERTELSWERTAGAFVALGLVVARLAGSSGLWILSALGVVVVVVGVGVWLWSSLHYEDLHGSVGVGSSPVHPTAARTLGLTTIAVIALASVAVVALFVAE